MTLNKEVRELIEEARRQGWRIETLRSGHTMMYAPDGEGKVPVAGTPSDRRALKNVISRMRRHGFEWPPKGRR